MPTAVTTEEGLASLAAQLEAEYDAAHEAELAARGTDAHPQARARFADAQHTLVAERSYWRQIGEAVDFGHPGKRQGITISNNDGSVAS